MDDEVGYGEAMNDSARKPALRKDHRDKSKKATGEMKH